MIIVDTSFTTHLEKRLWGITKDTKTTNREINKFYLIKIFGKVCSKGVICKFLTISDDNENFIIYKQYYIYNYTPHYLKVVYNLLVCYQNLTLTTKYNKKKRI